MEERARFVPAPGVVVGGRYRLERALGAGGMGEVWAAEHEVTGRAVALKFLKGGALDPASRRRFIREARASCAVDHPGIVAVHDVLEIEGGDLALVMDLLKGESLRERLARDGRLLLRDVAGLATGVCSALGAAHAAGIVHRDVKPENIFLIQDGGVRLVDFGVAKILEAEPDGDRTVTTQGAMLIGTPRYMSPEIALHDSDIDYRTDVWSLGLVLRECLTGTLPTALDSVPAIVKQLVAGIPPISGNAPDLPREVTSIIDRMLSQEREDRPSLEEVARAFEGKPLSSASGASEPIQYTTVTTPSRSRRPVWHFILACVLATALVATLLVKPWSHPQSSAPAPSSSAPASPRAIRIIDHPPPKSSNPQALEAYAMALRKFRGADFDVFMEKLDEAIKLDPSIGAAYLRRAINQGLVHADAADTFAQAAARTDSMDQRDRAILDAMQPMVAKHPSDVGTTRERLVRLVAAYPGDMEIEYLLAAAYFDSGDFEHALAAADRILAMDPEFAIVSAFKSEIQMNSTGTDAAMATVRDCVARTPTALNCKKDELWLLSVLGRCDEMGDRARDALALRHTAVELRQTLAGSLMSRGATPEAVLTSLRSPEPSASFQGDYDTTIRLVVDEYAGDFDAARVEARALEKAAEGDPSRERHGYAAWQSIELALEADRVADAARTAEGYLSLREAYVDDLRDVPWEIFPEAIALYALHRDKRIDRAELDRRTDALGDRWRERVHGFWNRDVWAYSTGVMVTTRVEAQRALLTFTSPAAVVWDDRVTLSAGRALFLAGRNDEALAVLEKEGPMCLDVNNLLEHLQTLLWLGRAREEKGDKAGACSAYSLIIQRWGNAKPKSVTAEEAKKRSLLLHCAQR